MSGSKLRILLCANACRPDMGSEPMVGWSAYQALRTQHDVRVICSASGQPSIQEAIREGKAEAKDFRFVPDRWRYCGLPSVDKLINWLNILDFQRRLSRIGREEIARFRPDITHQVTIATWRAGNPLAGDKIPFVWGPVGGGEHLPAAFFKTFSCYSAFFERLRQVSGLYAEHSRSVLKTARRADWIFAGNRQTASLLSHLRGHAGQIEILPVVAFSPEKMAEFENQSWSKSPNNGTIQIFSGGYVEARKGMGLALKALAQLRHEGFRFQYEHGGIGPERGHLCDQIQKLGLQDYVRFVNPYQTSAYRQKLRATDIFLFPSLRDNCPISLLEAMGYGCVPVVADHAGPGEMVTADAGLKIPITDPRRFVQDLAAGLKTLFLDRQRRKKLGEAARKRVLDDFSREKWLYQVERAYRTVLAAAESGSSPDKTLS